MNSPAVMDDSIGINAWRALLSDYDTVVLVANSEEALGTDLSRLWPGRTLFVFFNDARRVLRDSFDRDAALVLRSGREGPSVIRRQRLGPVASAFAPERLRTIVNLVVDATETPTALEMHAGIGIQRLDLTRYFAARYPGGKIASSGYAVAMWLCDLGLNIRVVLCGFDALRSDNWKVFDIHDWAFEQTALRLAKRAGVLELHPMPIKGPDALEAMMAQFPQLQRPDIVAMQVEVLAERLEHTNSFVDRLWSLSRASRFVRRILGLSRRTR